VLKTLEAEYEVNKAKLAEAKLKLGGGKSTAENEKRMPDDGTSKEKQVPDLTVLERYLSLSSWRRTFALALGLDGTKKEEALMQRPFIEKFYFWRQSRGPVEKGVPESFKQPKIEQEPPFSSQLREVDIALAKVKIAELKATCQSKEPSNAEGETICGLSKSDYARNHIRLASAYFSSLHGRGQYHDKAKIAELKGTSQFEKPSKAWWTEEENLCGFSKSEFTRRFPELARTYWGKVGDEVRKEMRQHEDKHVDIAGLCDYEPEHTPSAPIETQKSTRSSPVPVGPSKNSPSIDPNPRCLGFKNRSRFCLGGVCSHKISSALTQKTESFKPDSQESMSNSPDPTNINDPKFERSMMEGLKGLAKLNSESKDAKTRLIVKIIQEYEEENTQLREKMERMKKLLERKRGSSEEDWEMVEAGPEGAESESGSEYEDCMPELVEPES